MSEKFLKIKIDDETNKEVLVESESPDNNMDYIIKVGNLKFPMAIYNVICIGDEKVSIGSYIFDIKDLEVVGIDELEGYNPEDDLILKDVDAKLPDPYQQGSKRLGLFTEAVIIACITCDKKISLPRASHNKKMTIIRSIRNLEEGKDITVSKAMELLSYYGLSLIDVLKPECVVQK